MTPTVFCILRPDYHAKLLLNNKNAKKKIITTSTEINTYILPSEMYFGISKGLKKSKQQIKKKHMFMHYICFFFVFFPDT